MNAVQASELVEFANEASRGLDALDARLWRERIESRLADLEAAYAWLNDSGSIDKAVCLVVALEKYWMLAGRLGEGRTWLEQALHSGPMSDRSRAAALYSMGMLAFWQGEDATSRSAHDQSLALAQRVGDSTQQALALAGLARLALRDGALDEAASLCERALRISRDDADPRGRSSALHVLSVAAQMRGDLQGAREKMSQRLELEQNAGSIRLVAIESSNLSGVERQLGNLARARNLAKQALEIWIKREDLWAIPFGFNQLAAVAVASGEMERAVTLLASAARLVEDQGASWPPDEAPVFEASSATARRALGEDAFEAGWARGKGMPWRDAANYALGDIRTGAG
jgi:tetratricopeptide (TPR) repeat protein